MPIVRARDTSTWDRISTNSAGSRYSDKCANLEGAHPLDEGRLLATSRVGTFAISRHAVNLIRAEKRSYAHNACTSGLARCVQIVGEIPEAQELRARESADSASLPEFGGTIGETTCETPHRSLEIERYGAQAKLRGLS